MPSRSACWNGEQECVSLVGPLLYIYISITSLNKTCQSSSGSVGKESDRNSEEGPGSNSGQISVYPWTKNEANARALVAQLVRASDLHSFRRPRFKTCWISMPSNMVIGHLSPHTDTWTNQFVKTFSHETYLKVSWNNQVTQGRTMYGDGCYAPLKWQTLCVCVCSILPVQSWDDFSHGLGCSGTGWDNVLGSTTTITPFLQWETMRRRRVIEARLSVHILASSMLLEKTEWNYHTRREWNCCWSQWYFYRRFFHFRPDDNWSVNTFDHNSG